MVFSALSQSEQFFYNPSEIFAEDFKPKSAKIKVGGLVVPGTLKKDDEITATFEVVDFPEDGKFEGVNARTLNVSYEGVLPDLFAEGEGVVVSGLLIDEDSLIADDGGRHNRCGATERPPSSYLRISHYDKKILEIKAYF